MKCIYWNIRGLANSPSRLPLKRFITQHKLEIILIDEPWMKYSSFPSTWLHGLGLKTFAFNNRGNLEPNLWCICSHHLNLVIIDPDSQHVSFTISENNITFGICAIYASTNYITRRNLWNKLSFKQSNHNFRWCFLGDFNTILGAHEYRGHHAPARIPMDDFRHWSESNQLIHLPTRRSLFTWSNRRGGIVYPEKRLDKTICSQHGWTCAPQFRVPLYLDVVQTTPLCS